MMGLILHMVDMVLAMAEAAVVLMAAVVLLAMAIRNKMPMTLMPTILMHEHTIM